ncbi:MAG TPA: Xaa-Pro dipeptidase [Povalibacter sp.]|nr:Xaa-Pro dipeptidase [Povalibacter sp.]
MSTLDSLYEAHLRVLRSRTDDALAACGFDSLAIHSGRMWMQFLDDQPYAFKVNPHFKAWIPLLDAPDCWILYQPAKPIRLLFLQPNDYWHKPPAVPSDYWVRHFAIDVMRDAGEARARVTKLPNCALIGEWQAEYTEWGFAEGNPKTLLDRLHYPRATKTAYELECMRLASVRGAGGHRAAEAAFRAGKSEYAIHLAYLAATEHSESNLPYPNIVALNGNAAVLHYQYQERQAPSQRRSFLIDAGAEVAGYASDITRTYSAANDDFNALIGGMDRLQQELCAEVRPDVDYASIHLSAHRRIAALLRESDVIRTAPDAAVASGLSGVFFPHGIGHLLGLQVHDVAGFAVSAEGKQKARPQGHPYLRLTRTLEPGFVVTIEPGLYFIDSLLEEARRAPYAGDINWQQVERLKPYGGIRIEDDVVCTEGAPENLTRDAFAKL